MYIDCAFKRGWITGLPYMLSFMVRLHYIDLPLLCPAVANFCLLFRCLTALVATIWSQTPEQKPVYISSVYSSGTTHYTLQRYCSTDTDLPCKFIEMKHSPRKESPSCVYFFSLSQNIATNSLLLKILPQRSP